MYPSRNAHRYQRNRPRQTYGSSNFRRPSENFAQRSDDFRVQPNPQLQDSFRPPLHGDLSQSAAVANPEDIAQPTFPTLAVSDPGQPLSSVASSPSKRTVNQEDAVQDRPASATSGSVSSTPPSSLPPGVMGPMAPYSVVPPQAWMHPFAPYPYHMPYHPGYMMYPPPPPGYRPNPGSAEQGVGAPYPWPGFTYRVSPFIEMAMRNA